MNKCLPPKISSRLMHSNSKTRGFLEIQSKAHIENYSMIRLRRKKSMTSVASSNSMKISWVMNQFKQQLPSQSLMKRRKQLLLVTLTLSTKLLPRLNRFKVFIPMTINLWIIKMQRNRVSKPRLRKDKRDSLIIQRATWDHLLMQSQCRFLTEIWNLFSLFKESHIKM